MTGKIEKLSGEVARAAVDLAKTPGSGLILVDTPSAADLFRQGKEITQEVNLLDLAVDERSAAEALFETLSGPESEVLGELKMLVNAGPRLSFNSAATLRVLDLARDELAARTGSAPLIVRFSSVLALDSVTKFFIRRVLSHSEDLTLVVILPCQIGEHSEPAEVRALYDLLELTVQIKMWNRAGMVLKEFDRLWDRIDDEELKGLVAFRSGMYSVRIGKHADAVLKYEVSVRCFENSGNREALVKSLNNLGNIRIREERFTEARRAFSRALAIGEDLQSNYHLAVTYGNYAHLMLKQKKPRQAYGNLRKSLTFTARSGYFRDSHYTYSAFGECYQMLGREREAEEALTTAVRILEIDGNERDRAPALVTLAKFYAASSRWKEADSALDEAEKLYKKIAHPLGKLESLAARAELECARGDLGAASLAIAEARLVPKIEGDTLLRDEIEKIEKEMNS